MGSMMARVETWDGAKWTFASEAYTADEQILKPMVKAASAKYAEEKKIVPRTPADCQL